MAKLLVNKLARDRDGIIFRDIGYEIKKDKRKPRRFWFGRDETSAIERILHVRAVWEKVEAHFKQERGGEQPVWEEDSFQIAKAAARGDEIIYLEIPDWVSESKGREGQADVGIWLIQLQKTFSLPFLQIRLKDQTTEQAANEIWEAKRQDYRKSLDRISVPPAGSKQKLHEALEAFKTFLRAKYVLPGSQQVTKHGKKVCEDVDRLKDHQKDMALSAFDLEAIEGMQTHWQNRPVMKRGKPAAPDTVRGQIKCIRAFVRWLHKSKEFAWRKPSDYEVEPVRISKIAGEVSQRARKQQVSTYTLEEIGTLWQYATPRMRLYMALALNAGCGNMEVATIQTDEVILNGFRPGSDEKGNWLCRVRNKKNVYGEWELWDITVKGIQWYLAQRPASASPFLILNENGKPINTLTAGSNANQHIFNGWQKLLNQITKDKPIRKLTFNKLRKTATNAIRKYEGAEIAKIFGSHGETSTDEQIDRYSNRDFEAVFRGIEKFGLDLAPIFATVEDPFPANAKKTHPHYSQGTIKKIKEMASEGIGRARIAKEIGVSEGMVRHHIKCMKENQK